MTKEAAIELGKSEFWKDMTQRQIAEFQMTEPKLCMPFDIFHKAMEDTLGRPVFTHEFGLNFDGLKKELFEGKQPPTLEQIIEMIPEDKRIIVAV